MLIWSANNASTPTFTRQFFEHDQGETGIVVKGKQKANIQFWIDIGAYDFIIDIIRDGYKIPFYSSPLSVYLSNNWSALKNANFADTAVQYVLLRGLIYTCIKQPLVVNPLTVSIQSNTKKRLILDLIAVNGHLWKQSVKSDWTARQHTKLIPFLFAFDIHSDYHHVDIYESHTEFSWTVKGCGTFFFYFLCYVLDL
jgi:hypothetical protein